MASQDEFEGLRVIENKKVTGNTFECPWEKWKRPGLIALGNWKWRTPDYSNVPKDEELKATLPIIPLNGEKLNNPPEDKIQVMWVGHATVLVQFDGITILADPVFSDICGPLNHGVTEQWSLFGYRRYRPASCRVNNLPKVDAVIISHNHYDHLDKPSVTALNEKFPTLKWYVGKGLGAWFKNLGCQNVYQMIWWDKTTQPVTSSDGSKTFDFICTPAQHWCGRGAADENKCLWCSWIVRGPSGKKFFFAGDTGYHKPLFQKIGEKYGPFDLAALPIGAYEPREIVQYQHVNPEEAVRIHVDIKSEMSIGIHWGTLVLTNEFYLEPPQKVQEKLAQEKRNQTEQKADPAIIERLGWERFHCLNHGELWVVGDRRDEPQFMFIHNPTPTKL